MSRIARMKSEMLLDAPAVTTPSAVIESVSPTAFVAGDTITLTGQHLSGAYIVYFNGGAAEGTDIVVAPDPEPQMLAQNGFSLTVKVPVLAPGPVRVRVMTPGGGSNLFEVGDSGSTFTGQLGIGRSFLGNIELGTV